MAAWPPWWAALLVLLAAGDASSSASAAAVCPRPPAVEAILGPAADVACSAMDLPVAVAADRGDWVGVIEGDEAMLVRAVNLLHRNREEYVAVLFYASWCPFSKICKSHFQKLAPLFPSILHFAFEESIIRPSIISRYGIHGFPTLFLLNSTMRIRYHGPRTVQALAAFYSDISGVDASLDSTVGDTMVRSSNFTELKEDVEQENCPFWWARSPEKLLQQDTYLALATTFVVLRLLYLLFPKISSFAKWAWRRQSHTRFTNLMNVHEYFLAYLEQAKQGFNILNPCKRTNLHEGARSARAWASKSLASVSIGEPNTGRAHSVTERR